MEEMGIKMPGKKSMSGFFEAWIEISVVTVSKTGVT